MFSLVSLTIAGGVATAVATRQRKRSRLIDILSAEVTPNRSLVSHLSQLPFMNQKRARQIAALVGAIAPKSEAEAAVFTELKWGSLGVGLGVAGLFFFPLQIAGILCLLPAIAHVTKSAYHSLIHERRVTSDVLTTVFIGVGLAGGLVFELILGGWFVVLMWWLAIKTEDHSKRAIIDLFGQQIRSVYVLVDGVEVEVPVERVQAGDLIVIHAGQMAAMDGVIVEGYASIDQRMLTGEAQPAEKGPGDPVLAATLVLAGRIAVRVEKAGETTTAARIGRVLIDTSDFKATLVSRAAAFNDRMALPFILLSGLSLPFIGMSSALSILMATPGYRMVIYGPLSMLSYLHLAAQRGILIKDGRSLELLRDVDTVIFDKTGTLTLDQPYVSGIHASPGFSEETVLTYAAAAETKQSHPIARAILEAAATKGIALPAIDDAAYELGYGIQVKLNGKTIRVGSQRFMQLHEIALPPIIQAVQTEAHNAGHSLVLVAVDNALAGAILLQPTLRPEAQAMIAQLRARGVQLYIISGDHDRPTQHLAKELGMDGYFAEVLPEDKADLVKQLQDQGRKVCFVGDGINDSIALKSAHVSISLHGATTIAIDTAQIVLMDGQLSQLPLIFTLADNFAANMRVNFYAATLPCIVIIGGAFFLGWGLLLSTILHQVSLPFALYNTARPLLVAPKRQVTAAGAPVQVGAPTLQSDSLAGSSLSSVVAANGTAPVHQNQP